MLEQDRVAMTEIKEEKTSHLKGTEVKQVSFK